MRTKKKPTQSKPTTKSVEQKKEYLSIAIQLLTIVLMTYLYALTTPIAAPNTMNIPKGSVFSTIDAAQNQGVDVGFFDAFTLKLLGGAQSGQLLIGGKVVSKADFLYTLTVAKHLTIDSVIIPGETTSIILRQLSLAFGKDEIEFASAYKNNFKSNEGLIFPDTYRFAYDAKPEYVMSYLAKYSYKKNKQLAVKLLGRYDEAEWKRVTVIASVIQKEAASVGEMPLVASVIYNRLAKNMPLQMDGTLNYGLYSHQKVTPERIRNDATDYNTYKHIGLPKEPVCVVSKEALISAVYPAKTDYLYFMKMQNGLHSFSNSYNQHIKNIESVKKSNN